MKIQIVEDVGMIADRLERLTRETLARHLPDIHVSHSLESARQFIRSHSINLLMLDLNLHGKSGFELLEEIVAEPYHTIIVSAYADKALTAFEYGVLDFVPKPFSGERLKKALNRFLNAYLESGNEMDVDQSDCKQALTRFLTIRDDGQTIRIPLEKIAHLTGAGSYTEIHLEDGQQYLHCKSLGALSAILPVTFERIHKSHIVRGGVIENISIVGDHKYEALLQTGTRLPISRKWYQSHVTASRGDE